MQNTQPKQQHDREPSHQAAMPRRRALRLDQPPQPQDQQADRLDDIAQPIIEFYDGADDDLEPSRLPNTAIAPDWLTHQQADQASDAEHPMEDPPREMPPPTDIPHAGEHQAAGLAKRVGFVREEVRDRPTIAAPGSDREIEPRRMGSGNGKQKVNRPVRLLPTLIIAEAPRLRRFAVAMMGDERAADHLVQEALTEALAHPVNLPADQDLGVSLMMIVYRRRRQALEQQDQPQAPSMTPGFEGLLFQRLPGADRDEIREFAEAIGSIAEEDRAILLLIALENLDYRDIAAVVELPVGRIMPRIARARELLQQALKAVAPGTQNGSYRGETA